MIMPHQLKSLRPSEIRFTQDSILGQFQNGEECNDVFFDIKKKQLDWRHIPCIRVAEIQGNHYTANNRRLYIFRALECEGLLDTIDVVVIPHREIGHDITTKNDGESVKLRGGVETLPHSIRKIKSAKKEKRNRLKRRNCKGPNQNASAYVRKRTHHDIGEDVQYYRSQEDYNYGWLHQSNDELEWNPYEVPRSYTDKKKSSGNFWWILIGGGAIVIGGIIYFKNMGSSESAIPNVIITSTDPIESSESSGKRLWNFMSKYVPDVMKIISDYIPTSLPDMTSVSSGKDSSYRYLSQLKEYIPSDDITAKLPDPSGIVEKASTVLHQVADTASSVKDHCSSYIPEFKSDNLPTSLPDATDVGEKASTVLHQVADTASRIKDHCSSYIPEFISENLPTSLPDATDVGEKASTVLHQVADTASSVKDHCSSYIPEFISVNLPTSLPDATDVGEKASTVLHQVADTASSVKDHCSSYISEFISKNLPTRLPDATEIAEKASSVVNNATPYISSIKKAVLSLFTRRSD